MTRYLYIRIREPKAAVPLITEVLDQGVAPDHVRIYGATMPRGLPVKATRWRSTGRAFVEGAAVGAGLLLLLWLPFLGALGPGVIVLVLAAAGLAGLLWIWRTRAATAPVAAQEPALRDGELIIALVLTDADSGPLERRLAAIHPELMILGSDPAGTPPFP